MNGLARKEMCFRDKFRNWHFETAYEPEIWDIYISEIFVFHSKSNRSGDKLNWIAYFPKKKEVWTKKGKCVSPNPPSSAFSLFGDWGSYIFVTQNWGKSLGGKSNFTFSVCRSIFHYFEKFPYIFSERAELRLKAGRNANSRRMQYPPQIEHQVKCWSERNQFWHQSQNWSNCLLHKQHQ